MTLTRVWALSFLGLLQRSNPSPCLAKDKEMKCVAMLLLLSLAIAAPAFARGSHSSGSHSRAARGVTRNKHGRIKRSSAAKHAFERQHPCPSTGKTSGRCPGYVVDHVKALECGGADSPSNMQWQTIAEGKAKDKTERLCR